MGVQPQGKDRLQEASLEKIVTTTSNEPYQQADQNEKG
jgi:hypothetical protein